MGQSIVSPWIYYIPQVITTLNPPLANTVKSRLGLVGETKTGPAFQPTLVKNVNEFINVFGPTDSELDGFTKNPRYELPYIANSFLNFSEGLFVTRVLGFSGYDAGPCWAITIRGNYEYGSIGPTVTGGSYSNLFSFTADSQGIVTTLVSSDSLLQTLWNNNLLNTLFDNIDGNIVTPTDSNYTGGTLNDMLKRMYDLGSSYTGLSVNDFYLNNYDYDAVNDVYYGSTSGVTVYYSANTYTEVNDQVVALLRSRANYVGDEVLEFKLNGGSSALSFDTSVSGSSKNVYGDFKLDWSTFSGVTGSTTLSLDSSKSNFILNILGRTNFDRSQPLYVEALYSNIIKNLVNNNKVRGLNLSLVEYGTKFKNNKEKYQPSVTPWVVSQIKGSNISKLFRFWSKGDGDYTSNLFKVTISNIRPSDSANLNYDVNNPDAYDDYKFDVTIRAIDNLDTNAQPLPNEVFTKCSMNPKSVDYIGKKIGTKNGDYPSSSNYVLVEVNKDDENIALTFPAGFLGYPIRDYTDTQSGTAVAPYLTYKTKYETIDNVPKTYLGLSDTFGYDVDMFKYIGLPDSTTTFRWSGLTNGYHMDINATGATVDDVKVTVDGVNYYYNDYKFDVGVVPFDDAQNIVNTAYDNIDSRKFTLLPYGGFDGWDIYRLGRTNLDNYKIDGDLGILGEQSGNFKKITLTDNNAGLTSDYYAFLEGIWTFKNTDFININLFATPSIDTINHNTLVEKAMDMIEFDRADSLYIVGTPDIDAAGNLLDTQDVVSYLESYNTTYAATYWPWVRFVDGQFNSTIWLPPTVSVLTNIAKNDNTSGIESWYATAGVSRGDINVLDIRKNENNEYLSKIDIDYLYNNRINPLIKIDLYQNPVIYTGFKIWGNKTLANNDYLTNRVNVRRLMLEIRDRVIRVCRRYLFEPNDSIIKTQILNEITPLLKQIQDNNGITEFKVDLTTSGEMIDKGYLTGKIYLKPVKALEYIVFAFTSQATQDGFDVAFNQE